MQVQQSVYNTGARDGLVIGILLSAAFVLMSVGFFHNSLLPVAYASVCIVPLEVYFLLVKGYKRTDYSMTFSGVWLHGIVMFLCGGLIMGLVAYVYMRFVHPTFIFDQVTTAIDIYQTIGTEEARQMATTLQQVIDKHLLPTPIYVTFTLIWFVSFSGAMLSMLLAALVKLFKRKRILYK